ncbi:hypothetical protein DW788_08120 [Bifidobacterium longum]|nr:hypothetical protein DND34_06790 [Bifidobacterium longum subsp. longum]RGJ88209.1 hypothetical protein DXD41_05990 [Bifidobacterium longum]RGK10477.1 hypothetical protein DXD32_00705 [Bifidobacterium longum]RGK19363.1 hypothetical protein DXD28_04885 [Bifidobacterium longum]RGX22289.1 hypothetical protein DWV28_08055 [Bifidobacterium longum]
MALPGTVVAEQREHVLAPFVVAAVWIEQRVHRFQCGVDRAGTIVQRDAVRVFGERAGAVLVGVNGERGGALRPVAGNRDSRRLQAGVPSRARIRFPFARGLLFRVRRGTVVIAGR